MIIMNGQINSQVLDFNDKNHPHWNPNLTPAINRLGGIKKLVKSVQGRNAWAIMKFFRVLPDDPLLKALTFSQREFIIASMNEDAHQQELAAKGMKEESTVDDPTFEDKFYSNREVKLLEDGDDLDDIYRQSLQLKKKVDAEQGISVDYDKVISERIQEAYEEKMHKVANAKAQVQENWQKLLKESKDYYTDDD